MRILFLSQLVPFPTDAGAKVRSYHVLQYLAEAGHEVTLVAFRREGDRPAYFDHLSQYCSEIHTAPMVRSRVKDVFHLARSLINRAPFLIARDNVAEMNQLIDQVISRRQVEAIHADQLWMAQYALRAKALLDRNCTSSALVLDQHNAMYLIPRRLAASEPNPLKRMVLRREARAMERYEIETCHQFDHVVWVTDQDRSAFPRHDVQNGRNSTIPICVDTQSKAMVHRVPEARRVTFLGGLHWPPNAQGVVWFAREVWPQIVSKVPDAVLTIIGKNPPAALQSQDPPVVNLCLTGYVDDLEPYLAETAAFIVPLHAGGGMRVKIIDAWSWGLPIVTTTIGAEGLEIHHGENLLVADHAADFAHAVIRTLLQPEMAATLVRNGRETVETLYDWRKVYVAWDQIYER